MRAKLAPGQMGEVTVTRLADSASGKPRYRASVKVRDHTGRAFDVSKRHDSITRARQAARTRAKEILQEQLQKDAAVAAPDATTVAGFVAQWRATLHETDLHAKTRQDYEYVCAAMFGEDKLVVSAQGSKHSRLDSPIFVAFSTFADRRPAEVTPGELKEALRAVARSAGAGSAKHFRAVLTHAFGRAFDRNLIPANTVKALSGSKGDPVISATRGTSQKGRLDHRRAPTVAEGQALIRALRHDPEAAIQHPGQKRHRSPKGEVQTAGINGKDVVDIVELLFLTGMRIGEASALRWSDLALNETSATATISGTVVYLKGRGICREGLTKTDAGSRTVHLIPIAVDMLRRRATVLGVDLDQLPELPIFGPPQLAIDWQLQPVRWRDPRGLARVISILFDRHGMTWGRSHIGRKYCVNYLIGLHVPFNEIAKVVGWGSVATILEYADRNGALSPATLAGLSGTGSVVTVKDTLLER